MTTTNSIIECELFPLAEHPELKIDRESLSRKEFELGLKGLRALAVRFSDIAPWGVVFFPITDDAPHIDILRRLHSVMKRRAGGKETAEAA